MLRHLTARSVRAFTLRLGSGPEVTVNADADGILRAPPPQRGDPIDNGPLIEEAFPDTAEGLLSRYPEQIEDLRPKPAPEVEPEEAPVVAETPAPAPDQQPSARARRVAEAAPASEPDMAPAEDSTTPDPPKESEG